MAELELTSPLNLDERLVSPVVLSLHGPRLRLGRPFFRTLHLYGDQRRTGSASPLPVCMQQGGGLVVAVLLGIDCFDVSVFCNLVCVSHFARGHIARSKAVLRSIFASAGGLKAWQCQQHPGVEADFVPRTLHFVRIRCHVSQAAAAWQAYERRARHHSAFRLPAGPAESLKAEASALQRDLPDTALAVWLVCNGMPPGAFANAEVPGFGGRFLSLSESLAIMAPSQAGRGAAAHSEHSVKKTAYVCRALFLPISGDFGGRRMWLNRNTGAVHIGPVQPPCTSGSHFAALTPGQQAAAIFGRPKHRSMIALLRRAAGLVT